MAERTGCAEPAHGDPEVVLERGEVVAGHGAIVTTSSVNAFLPGPAVIDDSASRRRLRNFCKSLSKEVGPRWIRVNTVSPGPVATDLWLGNDGVAAAAARSSRGVPAAVASHAAAESVTGRFTQPSEIADLVLFLASEEAANITGADFTIDGGLIATFRWAIQVTWASGSFASVPSVI